MSHHISLLPGEIDGLLNNLQESDCSRPVDMDDSCPVAQTTSEARDRAYERWNK